MNRQSLFRHYWWIAASAAVLGIALIVYFAKTDQMSLAGSLVASIVAFCYFVLQQKLAETTLFKELFTEFNLRYDKLNEKLLLIASEQSVTPLEQRSTIIDYFNLCGEEYLFYKEGYILRDVWRSWCRGMLWYIEKEPFKSIWRDEQATNSYYGLTLAVIEAGAA